MGMTEDGCKVEWFDGKIIITEVKDIKWKDPYGWYGTITYKGKNFTVRQSAVGEVWRMAQ